MKTMNKFLLIILSFSSLSLLSADRSAEQFKRETEAKARRATEREQQEVQAIADELDAQEAPDAADVDSDDEVEANGQADLKDAVAQQESQAEQDLNAAEDILYNLKPVNARGFKGPGLPHHLQRLVAGYLMDNPKRALQSGAAKVDGQQGWRLFKSIEGLKGPVVAKVVGKLMTNKDKSYYKNYFDDKNGLISGYYEGSLSTKSDCNVAGKFMVTGEPDGYLKLWNINPYECIDRLKLDYPIQSIIANETGDWLAITFANNSRSLTTVQIMQEADKSIKLCRNVTITYPDIRPPKFSFYTGKNLKRELNSPRSLGNFYFDPDNRNATTELKDEDEFLCLSYPGDKTRQIQRLLRQPATEGGLCGLIFERYVFPIYNSSLHTHECSVTRQCYSTVPRYKKRNQTLNDTIQKKAITCLHIYPKNKTAITYDGYVQGLSDGSINIISRANPKNKPDKSALDQTIMSGQTGINGLQAFYTEKQDIAYLLSSADDGTIKIWENSQQDPFKKCVHCKKDKHAQKANKLMDCLCKQIKYCSKECQKADWKNHKATCSANPKNKDKAKA